MAFSRTVIHKVTPVKKNFELPLSSSFSTPSQVVNIQSPGRDTRSSVTPTTHISLELSLTPQKSHPHFSMLSVAGSLTIVLISSYPSPLASGSFVSFPADGSNWVSKEEGNFSSSCPTIWARCLLRWVLPTLQALRRPSVAVLPSKGRELGPSEATRCHFHMK